MKFKYLGDEGNDSSIKENVRYYRYGGRKNGIECWESRRFKYFRYFCNGLVVYSTGIFLANRVDSVDILNYYNKRR